jgi:predicted HTH transcriptional regulator
VKVPEMPSKPVYVKGETKRRVYVRRGDESVLASDELTEVLKQKHAEAGVTFEYGENEQMLFRYLNEYGEITVQKYADLINQTTYRAGKILVTLVSAGILTLFTKGPTDYYAFSKQV